MKPNFLENFMKAARQITNAERGMVVNADLQVVDAVNLDSATLNSPQFTHFAETHLRQAMDTNEAIITNNLISDPADAPTTNTNFSDLRVIVALPLVGYGALYLDQHIRHGVIPRETIERLMKLARHVLNEDDDDNASESHLVELYEQLA